MGKFTLMGLDRDEKLRVIASETPCLWGFEPSDGFAHTRCYPSLGFAVVRRPQYLVVDEAADTI